MELSSLMKTYPMVRMPCTEGYCILGIDTLFKKRRKFIRIISPSERFSTFATSVLGRLQSLSSGGNRPSWNNHLTGSVANPRPQAPSATCSPSALQVSIFFT
jgi:hypothetical protein